MSFKDFLEGIKQIVTYLLERKKLWLVPIVCALLLVSILIVVGESSSIGSLVYVLF